MNSKVAVKQLKEIEKFANEIRLAADGWDEDWQTLIATLMSARTKDKITIPVAKKLFSEYNTIKKLSFAKTSKIENIIKPINFYKTKSKHIMELAKIIVKNYNSKIPHEFEKLIELPGVGRKTANVFLAEQGYETIGVDTHVHYISNYMKWTKNKDQEKIEIELKKLFPKKYWGKINWILVRFGQTHTNVRLKNEILNKIKKIN